MNTMKMIKVKSAAIRQILLIALLTIAGVGSSGATAAVVAIIVLITVAGAVLSITHSDSLI